MDHHQVALQASLEKWVPDHAGRQHLDRTAEPTGCFLNESKVAIRMLRNLVWLSDISSLIRVLPQEIPAAYPVHATLKIIQAVPSL